MINYNTGAEQGALIAAIIGMFLIPGILIYILTVAGLWRTFDKAGKPGWAAIIPIYNYIVLLQIVGKPIWWIFLILFPCTTFIFAIWTINLLSKSFGQGEGFTIGLLILPMIFYPILGFSNYPYLGPSASEAGGLRKFDPSAGYRDPFNTPPPPQV
jgi:hypothetical protein